MSTDDHARVHRRVRHAVRAAAARMPAACGRAGALALFAGRAGRREAGMRPHAADAAARGDAHARRALRRPRRAAQRLRARGLVRAGGVRLESRRRDGRLPVQHGDARRDRRRARRQPDRARRRRDAEGAPAARARAARDAAVRDPPREHAEARARRRGDPAARTRRSTRGRNRSPTSSTSSSRACSIISASRTTLVPRWGEDRHGTPPPPPLA